MSSSRQKCLANYVPVPISQKSFAVITDTMDITVIKVKAIKDITVIIHGHLVNFIVFKAIKGTKDSTVMKAIIDITIIKAIMGTMGTKDSTVMNFIADIKIITAITDIMDTTDDAVGQAIVETTESQASKLP